MPVSKSIANLFCFGCCFLLIPIAGCGSGARPATDDRAAKEAAADSTAPIVNPKDIALAPEQSATLKVSSNPPGCMVFVNMVPVRTEAEGLALTPCEFRVPRGTHQISVERPGGKRSTQPVEVRDDRSLEFDVSSTPIELDDPSLLNAPLFEAAIGRSIALKSLNTSSRESDPFLTEDAQTIYFVSDRGGVRGVYSASRPSPYHDFDEPKIIAASSGADLPASPSVSGDGLILAYTVPEKARLWQLIRSSVEVPFDNKEIIRSDEKGERSWRSSQLSDDGLRLYWTEEGDDGTVTRAAVRSAPGKLFGKTLAFDLPGHHPHLSADGLRQFSFDGSKLYRSRRGSIRQPFGEPEVVLEVQPDEYTVSPQHRQFWVTEDEQWLYFCDDPQKSGDLYVVRLCDGPGWGRSYLGKPTASTMVANVEPEMPKEEPAPAETVDTRGQPLPYTTYWAELVPLFEAAQGEEAVALVKQASQKMTSPGDRELLKWDMQIAEALVAFDQDVREGVAALKPGAMVRIGGTRFELVNVDGETFHLKLKDKELTRTLKDLTPGERVSVAEGTEKADGAKALRFATYLYFQGKLSQNVAENWFKRAGDDGTQFHERLAARVLHQAKGELARKNLAAAIQFLDAVPATSGPNTAAAKQALTLRETLYDAIEWKTVGPRKWQRGEQGEYSTDASRSNGSYLTSERKYRDFELSCEWKVTGAGAMGGVYLRYTGQGKPLENGVKIQMANDFDVKRPDRFMTGALFGVAAPNLNAGLQEGKWNTLKLQARGTAVQVWINDKDVLQTTLDKDVANEGFVMLDGSVGGISYRKVLLFDLVPMSAE